MDVTPLPPGFEEIRREEQARAFRRLLRLRYFAHPVFLAIVLYVVINDRSWHRAVVMLGAIVAMLGAMVIETVLIRRKGISEYRIGYRDLVPLVLMFLLLALSAGERAARSSSRCWPCWSQSRSCRDAGWRRSCSSVSSRSFGHSS